VRTYYMNCQRCQGRCQGHWPVTEADVIDSLLPGRGVRVVLREYPLLHCSICAPGPCIGHLSDEAVELTRRAAENQGLIEQKARDWVRARFGRRNTTGKEPFS
jgi:hypothetical protein